MFGAVIGDIIGSPYRDQKIDTEAEDFRLILPQSDFTEISVMTIAVAEALMHSISSQGNIPVELDFTKNLYYYMKKFGRKFRRVHYGRKFHAWINVKKSFPYESLSNGAVLRISPIAWAFNNLEDVERFAQAGARVTVKTDETINFARVMAGMVFLARMKRDKDEIKNYFEEQTGLNFSATIEDLRPNFEFITKCPESMTAALAAFLENENFEGAIRSALSLGGDTTATASMAGALAEAYSGTRILTEVEAFEKLHRRLQFTIEKFEQWKS